MNQDIDNSTVADFGAQWTRYTDNGGYYGSVTLLADLFGPLLPVEAVAGKAVADIGSGTGRIVNMLMGAGAALVTAVEPSAAYDVLKRNTAQHGDKVEPVRATGDQMSCKDFDLVVSMGVLHHIVDPRPVVARAYQALKPGGRMLVWLYGKEGNEAYLAVAEPLRRLTTKLPDWALRVLCWALCVSVTVYIALCHVAPLPMRDYMRNHLGKLAWSKRYLTIFDQLNPAYAKYYTRAEAEALLAEAGFTDVATYHRHGYSWTVTGVKPS